MSVVMCSRCGKFIDMDYDCEVFTKNEIPNLDVFDECDWVCLDCLDDDEAEELEKNE